MVSQEPLTPARGGPPSGGLDQAAVFGPAFAERIGNNLAAARAGVLAPMLLLAVADGPIP